MSSRISARSVVAMATLPNLAAALALGAQTSAAANVVHLTGIVFDSIAAAPFAGAVVQAVMPEHPTSALSAVADANGHFVLDAVPVGRYNFTFYHGRLDSLGFSAPVVRVDVASDTSIVLATPSATTLARALCPIDRDASASRQAAAFVVGNVIDGTTLQPAVGALVRITTELRTRLSTVPVPFGSVVAGANGRFLVCGVPAERHLSLYAETRERLSEMQETTTLPATLIHVTFALVDSTGHSTVQGTITQYAPTLVVGTTIRGVVRDSAGLPMPEADVFLLGDSTTVKTDKAGRFTLRARPGHATIQIRAAGYPCVAEAVLVVNDDADREPLAVDLRRATTRLDSVSITGVETNSGFLARKKAGAGTFLDAGRIEALHSNETFDVIHRAMAASCTPRIFIDGNPYPDANRAVRARDLDMVVKPHEIAAMEIYDSDNTPPQFRMYGRTKSCGTVVIWRRP